MSTASVTPERFGYDKWTVRPSHVETRPGETFGRFVWVAQFSPMYAHSVVRAAFRSQEDAERFARILTERNEPFA